MTKKILYWLDRNFITFAIANKLQKKIPSESYAIIDDVEDQKSFFSHQSQVKFNKIWHFTDFVEVANTKPDLDLLCNFEAKYDIDFWITAYMERLFYSKINLYHNFSKSQILFLFQQECSFFEKILDEIKPDYLIISTITQHHMFLLYQICKSKGIQVLTMEPIHLGGKWVITSTIDRHIDLNEYEDFIPTSKKSFSELQNFLKEYKPLVQGHKNITRHQTSKIAKVQAVSNFILKSNSEEKHFAIFGKTTSSVLSKGTARIQQSKKNKRKKFIDNNFIKIIDFNEKIIYYPLTYEPEKSILLGSPFYTNQIAIISNIAKSIPIDFTLYVKEHPGMDEQGWREISYYEQILELPNVKLIHPSVSNEELVKNCLLAMTIRGTVGLESALFEKPAINFNFNSGYSELPSVQTVTDFEELPKAIKSSLTRKVNLYDVNKYLDYMNKISFDYDHTDYTSEFSKKFNFQVGYLHKVKIDPNEMDKFLKEYETMFDLVSEEFVKKIY
jgi:hypothetical protein